MGNDIYELALRKRIAAHHRYEYVGAFSQEGIARALRDKTWIYIDRRGRLAFAGEFETAYPFHDGVALVTFASDAHYVLITTQGKAISKVPLKQVFDRGDEVVQFIDGLALVQTDQGWGFMGLSGEFLGGQLFSEAYPFFNDLALVRDGNKAWYIDKSGQNAFGRMFDHAWSFIDGMATIEDREKKFIIDRFGNRINSRGFVESNGCGEGFAAVSDRNGWYFIDRFGKAITKDRFDGAEFFSEGLGVVYRDNKANYLSSHGVLILGEWVDDAWPFENGVAVITVEGKRYFINKGGMKLHQQPFDHIHYRDALGYYHVALDKKYYCVDAYMRIVSPGFDIPLDYTEGLYETFVLEPRRKLYIDSKTWEPIFS